VFIDFCPGPLHAPRSAEPTHDDLKMSALYGEKKKAKKAASASTSHVVHAVAGATSQPCADPNELRPAELKRITRGCLEYLGKEGRGDATYVAHLVTATLCLGMAPRQQVLRQLRLGSSFVKKDDGRYWILMLSHMNKNGKATTFSLATELTPAFDLYLETIRPQLLGSKQHDFVFCKRNGDPPGEAFDFSEWTRSVTKELIARPINAHAFRGGIVKAFHKTGATQVQMNDLADVMGHDPATARNHYYRIEAEKSVRQIHERLRQPLGAPVASPPAPPAYSPLEGGVAAAAATEESAEADEEPAATSIATPDAVAVTAGIATAAAACD